MVRYILKLESLTIFLVSLYCYQIFNGNWIWFVVLLLAPDISMIGYLKDKKLGATVYNLVHNYVLPLFLICLGLYFHNVLTNLGLILLAHVGMDRFFGFGLKYPTDFKDTHLQKV